MWSSAEVAAAVEDCDGQRGGCGSDESLSPRHVVECRLLASHVIQTSYARCGCDGSVNEGSRISAPHSKQSTEDAFRKIRR